MGAALAVAVELTSELFGPQSPVPWWAWVALLAMIFMGLLLPTQQEQPPSPAK
jgi:hypothetical protein